LYLLVGHGDKDVRFDEPGKVVAEEAWGIADSHTAVESHTQVEDDRGPYQLDHWVAAYETCKFPTQVKEKRTDEDVPKGHALDGEGLLDAGYPMALHDFSVERKGPGKPRPHFNDFS